MNIIIIKLNLVDRFSKLRVSWFVISYYFLLSTPLVLYYKRLVSSGKLSPSVCFIIILHSIQYCCLLSCSIPKNKTKISLHKTHLTELKELRNLSYKHWYRPFHPSSTQIKSRPHSYQADLLDEKHWVLRLFANI